MNTENNKIISEFMIKKRKAYKVNANHTKTFVSYKQSEDEIKSKNWEGYKPDLSWELGTGIYHSDWNWLMEVVEKIESLRYNVEFSKSHCVIIAEIEKPDSKRITKYSESKIQAVYNACIEFIKWHNLNNK